MQSPGLELEERLTDDRRSTDPSYTDDPSLPNDTDLLHKDEDSSDYQPGSSSSLRQICSLSVIGRAALDLVIVAPSIYFLLFAVTAAWNNGRSASSDLSQAILRAAPLVSCADNGITSLTSAGNRAHVRIGPYYSANSVHSHCRPLSNGLCSLEARRRYQCCFARIFAGKPYGIWCIEHATPTPDSAFMHTCTYRTMVIIAAWWSSKPANHLVGSTLH